MSCFPVDLQQIKIGGRGSGGVKSTGVSQSVRETSRDESQNVLSTQKLFKTRDLELPILQGSLPSCSSHSAGYTSTSVHPCFPVAKKRPLRTKSGKRPIKVRKRPVKEGKRPIKAMVLVGISVGCLMGLFSGTPAMVENGPSKKAH